MSVLRTTTVTAASAAVGAVLGWLFGGFAAAAVGAFTALATGLVLSVASMRETRRNLAQAVARDRRTETILRETQERFRLIAETVTEVFWMADVTIDRMVYISPGYERLFGRTCESLYREPKSFMEAIHADDFARVRADYGKRKRLGLTFDQEYRIVRPDGSIRWIWDRGFPICNDLGEVIHYVGAAQDVTDRRSVEQNARELAERFNLVCQATTDGIWDWDVVTNTAWWSPTYFATFDIDVTTVPGYETWAALIHPDDRARVLGSFEKAVAAGHATWTEEYRLRHGNGTWCDVFDRAYVLCDDTRKVTRVIGATMDISERRKLEHRLRHAQKMEALGQLAGGVAHDFNNILQAIQIQTRLLQKTHALPTTAVGIIADMHVCVDRAAGLTRQLLRLGRREVIQLGDVDVSDAVTSFAKVLQRMLGDHVTLNLALSETPAIARADRGMLDQVLLNLALNARDSMPEGGELSIATSLETTGDPPVQQVCLTVRDSGCGIAPEVLPRIFEPFFTTKQSGEGSGLGLASTFGIIAQHRGSIEVASTLGHGATFRICLPVGSGSIAATTPTRELQHGASERILLVEDDEAVRSSTRQILEREGYFVCEAASGVEALDRWEDCGRVDLVLTDVVMPGKIDGCELAAELERRSPGLRVVFATGHRPELELREHHTLVLKPLTAEALLGAVRASLDT